MLFQAVVERKRDLVATFLAQGVNPSFANVKLKVHFSAALPSSQSLRLLLFRARLRELEMGLGECAGGREALESGSKAARPCRGEAMVWPSSGGRWSQSGPTARAWYQRNAARWHLRGHLQRADSHEHSLRSAVIAEGSGRMRPSWPVEETPQDQRCTAAVGNVRSAATSWPLTFASFHPFARLLPCSPSLPSLQRQTPLGIAAYQGEEQIVEALIRHGADLSAADATGSTPVRGHLGRATPSERAFHRRCCLNSLVVRGAG